MGKGVERDSVCAEEDVVVYAVVPAVAPPFCEEVPVALETGVIAEPGGVRMLEDGVYRTDAVSALEPAEADADEEYEFTAPVPLAPEDEFACTKSEDRSSGCWRHRGAISRMRWYWFACV
jgi:hypothetical protein